MATKRKRLVMHLPSSWDQAIAHVAPFIRQKHVMVEKWTDGAYVRAIIDDHLALLATQHPKPPPPKPLTEQQIRDQEAQAQSKAYTQRVIGEMEARMAAKRAEAERVAKLVGGTIDEDGKVSITHEQFLAMEAKEAQQLPQYQSVLNRTPVGPPSAHALERRREKEEIRVASEKLIARVAAEREAKEKAAKGGV